MKPVLSVVGPVHNERHSLPEFNRRLLTALRALDVPFEVIYVDDGSTDGSREVLRGFHKEEPAVKVLELSRNFGHQLAITAGMDHAAGDACVIIDTDGQDPPESIGDLMASWRAGNEVVFAVRTEREGESWFKKLTASLFYRLMRRITNVPLPLDAGDFRLVDRKVLEVMGRIREHHRFMRGLTCWVGFKQAKVEYARKARLAGETHYPFWKMARFAADGITSFSHEPLRWVTYVGMFAFAFASFIGVWVLYVKVYNDRAVQGWASVMALILFLGGAQLIAMGVIGEYLARIFDEVKGRPLYVVGQSHGLKNQS